MRAPGLAQEDKGVAGIENRKRGLTLEQIGERAGVSRSTVSRVLNDQENVREDVRTRVQAVIAETGYRPNPAARALVSNRSGLIGLVVLTDVDELFGDPYYSELVSGIQQGCAEHDLIFTIVPVPRPTGQSDTLAPQLARGLFDGVIVTAGPRSGHLISGLRDLGMRIVVIGQPDDDDQLLRVDVENRLGSRAAVDHLIEDGYERIGFVGPTSEFRFGVERLAGYGDALIEAGSDSDDQLVRRAAPTEDGGRSATLSLLAERPDAIFVSTDPMAAGAYQALAERDLRIPDDVAIIGFDGLPRQALLDPPLSTVVQPVAEVGRTAVGLLAAEGDDARNVILPTSLRLAGSCDRRDDVAHLVT